MRSNARRVLLPFRENSYVRWKWFYGRKRSQHFIMEFCGVSLHKGNLRFPLNPSSLKIREGVRGSGISETDSEDHRFRLIHLFLYNK